MSSRKKRRLQYKHDQCVLITPIQKGFPITDFEVTADHRHIVTGNALGNVSQYRVPTLEEKKKRKVFFEESKEDLPYLCYQLQKFSDAAIRHIWIQKDRETGDKRLIAFVGFHNICVWRYEDVFDAKPKSDGRSRNPKYKAHKQAITHPFYKNKQTDIYSIRHGQLVTLFASQDDKAYMIDLAVEKTEQRKKPTGYKLPKKTEVVSFDGTTYCFLVLDPSTGRRDLLCKKFNEEGMLVDCGQISFPKSGTNYCCFQIMGRRIAYCSNNNVVKIYDLDREEVVHRLKGHSGYILAIHYDGETVCTLGSDRKIKLWRDGKCCEKIKKIPGVFNPGYLYKVLYRDNCVYYTADDGLFVCYVKGS